MNTQTKHYVYQFLLAIFAASLMFVQLGIFVAVICYGVFSWSIVMVGLDTVYNGPTDISIAAKTLFCAIIVVPAFLFVLNLYKKFSEFTQSIYDDMVEFLISDEHLDSLYKEEQHKTL